MRPDDILTIVVLIFPTVRQLLGRSRYFCVTSRRRGYARNTDSDGSTRLYIGYRKNYEKQKRKTSRQNQLLYTVSIFFSLSLPTVCSL